MIFKELYEGIPHIEDLPVNQFVQTLRTLSEYEITEKVDGSQLLFGIDERGLYTSREGKGGDRIYSANDYPKTFANVYMISAHKALKSALYKMEEAGLKIGDQVEIEVLYGELPNVVAYSPDKNYIIFLRTTEGDVDIDNLRMALNGVSSNVFLHEVPFTTDGKHIQYEERHDRWFFSSTPKINYDKAALRAKLNSQLLKIDSFLNSPSGVEHLTNGEVLSLPLNKKPEWVKDGQWSQAKAMVKSKQDELSELLNTNHVSKIKTTLLNHFVRNTRSGFGPEITDGGWIEGVVLQHPKTKKLVKIVDKDIFGVIKDFSWEVRNKLTKRPRTLDNVNSFLGNVLVKLCSAIGCPEVATYNAKSYIRKLGNTVEERLRVIADNVDFGEAKHFCVETLQSDLAKLEEELSKYSQEKDKKQINVKFGDNERTFGYNKSIDNRTKQVFAKLFSEIETFINDINSARNADELVMAIMGKQINEA